MTNLRFKSALAVVGKTLVALFGCLLIKLVMENLVWVVGAAGAPERATMLTMMFAGILGAAVAGGGLLGWQLAGLAENRGRG